MTAEKPPFNTASNHYAWLTWSTIAMLFGMQTLRVFFPGLMWSVSRDPTLAQLLIIIMAVFGLPMPILYFLRSMEVSKLFLYLVIGQVFLRLLEQISQRAITDFFISWIGVFFFVSLFFLAFLYAPDRSFTVGAGVLVGVLLDTTLRGSLWTLDLSWQKGFWPIGLVLIAGLAQGISAINAQKSIRAKEYVLQSNLDSSGSFLALNFGIFLFLQQHIFQDISQIILLSGLSFPLTLFYLTVGNYVITVLALILIGQKLIKVSRILIFSILLFGLIGLDYASNKNLSLLEVFLGNFLVSNLFVSSLKVGKTRTIENHKKFLTIWGIGIMLYALLVVLYYITFTPLAFIIIVAMIFILLSWIGIREISLASPDIGPKLYIDKRFLIALIVLVLPGPLRIVMEQSGETIPRTPSTSDRIRILSINLHQGFDAFGNMAIAEQTQIIKASGADIISMNEVSRGWLLDGSLDMYVWLSHELNMYSSFGPAMGHLNGNAVFSRFPISYSENSLYSNDPSSIPRGYLYINTSFGDSQVNIISTHLAWANAGALARDIEAQELVGRFQDPGTLIIGDMNAFPDSKTIGLFKDAGFIDAFTVAGQGTGNTWHSLEPVYRLDYVFGSKDIHFVEFKIVQTTVSDHLPLLVTISP